MFKPPFELYRESDIADQNGHVCSAENRDFARAILHALNTLYVDGRDWNDPMKRAIMERNMEPRR